MKYPIELLQAEHDKLASQLAEAKQRGKPGGWRDSEWAMQLGSIKGRVGELFEALQILRKVGKE